jgi:uncharacterized membrane protein YccC
MFTCWLVVYFTSQQLGLEIFGLGIFTVIASFVCNYIMAEVGTEKRTTALGTTLLAMFAAIVLVALLNRNNLLIMISIVLIFFLSYYVRKYSLSLHVVGFVAVASFYFAWVFNVNSGNLAPFIFAIIAAALSNFLFWSVIMPPRPIGGIRRAILSLYLRSAAILFDLGTDLEIGEDSEKKKRRSRKQMRRLERSMRMVESVLPEALERSGLSDRSEIIRTTLFSTSRAIRIISNEGQELVALGPIELGALGARLATSLRDISDWLGNGAPQNDWDRLGSYLKDQIKMINSSTPEGAGKGHAGLLLITAELYTLFENACTIRTISDEIRSTPGHQVPSLKKVKKEEKKRPLTQTTRLGGWDVSLPTLMAAQALAAGFIALGIGYALGISPLYQAFWFALVTVAGSLGETRLKSLSRIIGTASGVILGLALAFIVGDSDLLIVMAILIGFFLLEFSRTVSLNWFICFLVTILVLAMTGAGANPIGFSISLIISSAIGVGAALLSTSVLFPIKIRDRYTSALSEYLIGMQASLQAYLESPKEGHVGIPKKPLMSQAERFRRLEQVSQANLMESNPFASLDRDRSYEMTTILESLNNDIMKLDADTGIDRMTNSPMPTVIDSIIEVIKRNISSIETHLKNPRSAPIIDEGKEILKEWIEEDAGKDASMLNQPYRRDIFPIMDIHDILQVLAKSLSKKF